MHAVRKIGILLAGLVWVSRLAAADAQPDRALLDAETTYELRLERQQNRHGVRAVIEMLQRDLKERPRPYVKAWYANYLLWGAGIGLNDIADPKRGIALAKESRDEGSVFGLELVGRAYGSGTGTGYRDSQLALKCLREAAERGRGSAMCGLAKYYFFGFGVRPDRAEAERWARKAAWLGASAGLSDLSAWWGDPKYGAPDAAKAMALTYEAAEYGDPAATSRLYAAADKNDPLAEKYIKLRFLVGVREGTAARPYQVKATAKWLEANCAADDWPVQLALAEAMIERNGPVYDPAAAREKLNRAAAAGVDDARALLAEMAWRGIGEQENPTAAIAAWRELAARHNARGLNRLGWLHWWGNAQKYGVSKDGAKAFDLCRQAADLGYWVAQENVADCYAHGIGTEQNYYLAAKYYGELHRRGFIHAGEMRDRILALVKD